MKNQRPTILILTSQTGGGHLSLAGALADRLAADFHIEIHDPQPTFFHWHYRLVSRYALWLWAAEFRQSNTAQQALLAHRMFTPLVMRALITLIQCLQPALIITTYPFLSYEVTAALQRMSYAVPFGMLFADPDGVHASWLTERSATATLVPTRETYAQALKSGFAPARTHLVGWPVRGQFQEVQRVSRAEFLRELQLDPECFTIFLQGGGEGAAQFSQTVARLQHISPRLQFIVATGTNQALYRRFSASSKLYALPFTSNIAPYMAAADAIMGKAGPNMLFESVALGKPFIATTYIPGQEQNNLAFIQRHGLGWVALQAREQHELLLSLASNLAVPEEVQRAVLAYRDWNAEANQKIVPLIHSLIKGS